MIKEIANLLTDKPCSMVISKKDNVVTVSMIIGDSKTPITVSGPLDQWEDNQFLGLISSPIIHTIKEMVLTVAKAPAKPGKPEKKNVLKDSKPLDQSAFNLDDPAEDEETEDEDSNEPDPFTDEVVKEIKENVPEIPVEKKEPVTKKPKEDFPPEGNEPIKPKVEKQPDPPAPDINEFNF